MDEHLTQSSQTQSNAGSNVLTSVTSKVASYVNTPKLKVLEYNKSLIQNVLGKQGSAQCGVYSIAYGYTILERACRVSGSPAAHNAVASSYNNGVFALVQWKGLTRRVASSKQDRYKAIMSEIDKGKPVVIAMQGTGANHFILVIGYMSNKNHTNISPSDFYICDPASNVICFFGEKGFTSGRNFNGSQYGLVYGTYNSGSAKVIYTEPTGYSGTSEVGDYVDTLGSGGSSINWQVRASKLSSSDNFEFVGIEEQKETQNTALKDIFKNEFNSLSNKSLYPDSPVFVQTQVTDRILSVANTVKNYHTPNIPKSKTVLAIADNLVEAPFIEVIIGGYSIGSYRGSIDEYPNYVNSLTVVKQNGILNQYTLELIYQIRPGEDANILDEMFATSNYDKIQIKYGDANSGAYFKDEHVVITNVRMSRNYTNMSISYTIEATSEGHIIKTFTTTFPGVVDKPSNVLRNLLYSNKTTSAILLDAFQKMKNKQFVDNNNLIPTNDSVVKLDAQVNVSILDYINYLVACMSRVTTSSNILRDSTYYISYLDTNEGAYFSVKELVKGSSPYSITDKLYSLTVGFNEDLIYSFSVDATDSWELLYKNSQRQKEYYYSIQNDSSIVRSVSPSLTSSTSIMSEVNKNWWTQMTKFPLTAKITLKGLLKPVMLMDYININVVFYGQQHITSGVYAVTGQTDSLSAAGYKTTLSLVRISDD